MLKSNITVEKTDESTVLYFGCATLTVIDGKLIFRCKDVNDSYKTHFVTMGDDDVKSISILIYEDEVDK